VQIEAVSQDAFAIKYIKNPYKTVKELMKIYDIIN